MKIDLSDVKVGDEVFHPLCGYTKVTDTDDSSAYPIRTRYRHTLLRSFTMEGKRDVVDVHPSLFHSYEEFKAYWQAYEDEQRYVDAEEAIKAFREGKRIAGKEASNSFVIGDDEDIDGSVWLARKMFCDTSGEKKYEILD